MQQEILKFRRSVKSRCALYCCACNRINAKNKEKSAHKMTGRGSLKSRMLNSQIMNRIDFEIEELMRQKRCFRKRLPGVKGTGEGIELDSISSGAIKRKENVLVVYSLLAQSSRRCPSKILIVKECHGGEIRVKGWGVQISW